VAINIVMPSALRSRMTASTSPTSSGSSALVTSSSSSARGCVASARHDRHALLLAAGEPVGVLVLAAAEPEAREQLAPALARLLARHALGAVGSTDGSVITSPSRDVAVVDLLQQVDTPQQRRLARARGADQRHRLVLVHRQVDPTQDLGLAVGLGDAADLEHWPAHRRCIRSTTRASGTVTHR
jgi:hypothetical protein